MRILVLNCGSSSIKYQLIRTHGGAIEARGNLERIGTREAILRHEREAGSVVRMRAGVENHAAGVEYLLAMLISPNHGVLTSLSEIDAVGHRVVHGGEEFSVPVLITPEVLRHIEYYISLAPLHNPHNIRGIEAATSHLPSTPQVAVFDTAFHSTLPPHAYLYAIPYAMYRRHHVRRYGFHGTSHHYVAIRTAELLGRPLDELNLITCHLGNGCSVCAIAGGRSVDTSMGFTPLEGLMMGTRSGDIDAGAVAHLMSREDLTPDAAIAMLNKLSGLAGIAGASDMREVIAARDAGDGRARLAFDMFCHRVRKYIGAYAAVLGRVDALVFTGGIGENSAEVRESVCSSLSSFGISIDLERNADGEPERRVSADASPVGILVVPTNEELMIARETERIVRGTPFPTPSHIS